VTGILAATRGADDTFIYLRLADAQRRFNHPGELTHILVRLADPNDLDNAVAQLRGCDAGLAMNVVPLAHVFHTIQSLVNPRVAARLHRAGRLAGGGPPREQHNPDGGAERRREIGVMRAIGASRRDIFQLIWLETIQVCVSGAIAGVAVAFLASHGVETWVRSRLPICAHGRADSLGVVDRCGLPRLRRHPGQPGRFPPGLATRPASHP